MNIWRFPCYINKLRLVQIGLTFQMRPFSHFQPILQLDLRWPLTLIYEIWPHQQMRVPMSHLWPTLVEIHQSMWKIEPNVNPFTTDNGQQQETKWFLYLDLCNIEKWATSWNVLFGAAKCKTVTISNQQDAKDSHPCLQFFGTTLTETETVELLGLTLSKDLSWKHDVTSMAKSAAQRTGLLCRVAPYLLPTQRAMIYKAIIRSKMEYASSAWFGATPTSLSQLDAVERHAIRIIDLPVDDLISHQIQPLGTRREVGALTLSHRMYYGEAPELLCQLLPEHLQLNPCLRRSVRSHDFAVQIPRFNLVSHKRSFVPSAARIWNSLPEYIPSLEKRACFKKEVNRYLGDN